MPGGQGKGAVGVEVGGVALEVLVVIKRRNPRPGWGCVPGQIFSKWLHPNLAFSTSPIGPAAAAVVALAMRWGARPLVAAEQRSSRWLVKGATGAGPHLAGWPCLLTFQSPGEVGDSLSPAHTMGFPLFCLWRKWMAPQQEESRLDSRSVLSWGGLGLQDAPGLNL